MAGAYNKAASKSKQLKPRHFGKETFAAPLACRARSAKRPPFYAIIWRNQRKTSETPPNGDYTECLEQKT
jgi:hypothetical protein